MHVDLLFRSTGRCGLVMVSLFVAMVVAPGFAQVPADTPAAQEQAVPVIKVDNPVHDFGTTWVGPRLRCLFTIANAGNADLVITGVDPGCDSLLVAQKPSTIKPGKAGQVLFFLNPNKVSGKYTKHPIIKSNDQVTPELKLTIKGEVKRRIEVMPLTADFGAVYGNEPKTQVLKIKNNMDTPLELALDPFASMGKFRFKLTQTVPGQEFELEVKTAPPFKKFGMHQENAVIMTNQTLMRQLRIQATIAVKDRLDVEPTEITLKSPTSRPSGQAPKGAHEKPVLTFTNYGETPVKVVEATVNDPRLKLSVQKHMDNSYRIQLDVPADYVVPGEGRTVTIKTDDAEKPVLEVPIKKLVERPRTPQRKRPPSPAEKMVGQDVPDFKLTTMEGKTVVNDEKIAVLDFYASQCGFCRRQVPRVDKLRPEYEAKGVRFLYVTRPWRGAPMTVEDQTKFMKQIGVKGSFALDEGGEVGDLFSVRGVPSMAIVGKTGKIEAVNVGNIPDLEEKMKGQLDALLAGKPIPDELLPEKE